MSDLTSLLSELGLQQYSRTFEEEEFTDPALLLSMRADRRQPALEQELGMQRQHAALVFFGGGLHTPEMWLDALTLEAALLLLS